MAGGKTVPRSAAAWLSTKRAIGNRPVLQTWPGGTAATLEHWSQQRERRRTRRFGAELTSSGSPSTTGRYARAHGRERAATWMPVIVLQGRKVFLARAGRGDDCRRIVVKSARRWAMIAVPAVPKARGSLIVVGANHRSVVDVSPPQRLSCPEDSALST